MIDIQLKECCRECEHIDLNVDEIEYYASGCEIRKGFTIECKHRPVCKEYIESPKDSSIVKDIVKKTRR